MLYQKHVTQFKKVFNGLISRFNTTEERINYIKDRSLEPSQTKI